MQSGHRDQVWNAGGARDRPFALAHRVLIPERERAQQMRAGRIAKGGVDGVADACAQAVDAEQRGAGFMIFRRIAYLPGGDDAGFERVALEIETTGIDAAARTLQAHLQTPIRTRCDVGRGIGSGVVPSQAQSAGKRDGLAFLRGRIRIELEARGVVLCARQAVDAAADNDIRALQRMRQALRKRQIRPPHRPCRGEQEEAEPACATKRNDQRNGGERERAINPARRQPGQRLHRQCASEQRQSDGGTKEIGQERPSTQD